MTPAVIYMSRLTNITNYSDTTSNPFQECEDYPEGVFIWICVCVVSFVLGFPASVAVLWEIFQSGRKGKPFSPYDIFVLNIAVIDGLFLLFLLPELYNYRHWHNLAFEMFSSILYSFNLCGRPLFTSCICLDCYLAVVHPVVYRANKSLTHRVLIAVGVWTVMAVHGIFSAGIVGFYNDFIEICFIFLTLPIIGFCDVTILWTLKRSNQGGGIHPMKKKALQIIINNLVVTFTAYLPPIIASIVSQVTYLDSTTFLCLVSFPVMCSTLIGNTVYPILYLNNLGKLDRLKWWRQK